MKALPGAGLGSDTLPLGTNDLAPAGPQASAPDAPAAQAPVKF